MLKPKYYNIVLAYLAGTMMLAAQSTPAAAPAAAAPVSDKDEVVHLSPFQVSGAADTGRYTSLEATSAGRVRLNIMDSSSTVSVITSDMLADVGAGRILDATKYISGISESTLPNAQDRTNVRGFQADGHTVDGFTYGGFLSLDPVLVDRIEVVKGPNSILAPQPTSPGGTVNNATKKPQFRDFGSITLSLGAFDANSANFDYNQKISDKAAMRVIGSFKDAKHWWDSSYTRSETLMIGATYNLSEKASLTAQYIYTDWKASLYLGLPIDPSSGTNTEGKIIAGVPRDLSVFAGDIYRIDQHHDFKLLFTAELWKGFSTRFNALYHKSSQYAPQLNTSAITNGSGGARDPKTGIWTPGFVYGAAPTYTQSVAPAASYTFQRSGTDPRNDPRQFFLQNDYLYQVQTDSFKSTTLVGFAYTETHDYGNKAFNISAPNFNISSYAPVLWTKGTLNFDNRLSTRFIQGYIRQDLAFMQDRLFLNGAVAKNDYRQRVRYLVGAGNYHETEPTDTLPSYGVVIKPLKNKDMMSLYANYAEQSSSLQPSNSVTNTNPLLQSSKQTEYGVRLKPFGDKLYFTVTHFDIKQNNFSVPNPGNLTTPPPNPLLPALFSDRTAKGWEYEVRANPTKSISIIGNYTSFKNRDPNNVEFRGTAEKSGGVLVSYSFDKDTALDGLRVAVGVDYIGDRPGDAAPAPVLINGAYVAQQPSFYLGARTLVNATVAYTISKQWGVQLNVDNVFDKEYLMASINRGMVYVGTPINFRFSATRKF